jgi:hypothetical protein
MKETIINIYPITQFILVLFAIVGGYNLLNNVAHLLARCSKDKLDNKKDIHCKDCDTDIVQDLIQKFPLVSPAFMNKNTVEQNIENNQEIHEINIRLYDIEKRIEEIRRTQRGGL